MAIGGAVLGLASKAGETYFNAREAAKNRKFQKKMYKHRIRYTVSDMKKAGINPILATQFGGSAPPGSMATAASTDPVRDETSASGANVQRKLGVAQIANIEASTAKTNAEASILGPKAALYQSALDNVMMPLLNKMINLMPSNERDALDQNTAKYPREHNPRRKPTRNGPEWFYNDSKPKGNR